MKILVIATRNAHKVVEIRAILGDGFRYLTLDDFAGPPEVVEDAGTFAANATKKAAALAKWLGQTQIPRANAGSMELGELRDRMFVLADDSGLEVDALRGAPGVHSARFAALDTGQPGNSPTGNGSVNEIVTSAACVGQSVPRDSVADVPSSVGMGGAHARGGSVGGRRRARRNSSYRSCRALSSSSRLVPGRRAKESCSNRSKVALRCAFSSGGQVRFS